MILTRENRRIGRENPVTMPLFLPQISHELAWDRTRTSAVRGRRLTTETDCTEALIQADVNKFMAMKFYGIVKNSESIFRQGIEEMMHLWGMGYQGFVDEDKLLLDYPEDGGGKLLLNVNNYHCPQCRCEGESP
jgi:hypothetical protein